MAMITGFDIVEREP